MTDLLNVKIRRNFSLIFATSFVDYLGCGLVHRGKNSQRYVKSCALYDAQEHLESGAFGEEIKCTPVVLFVACVLAWGWGWGWGWVTVYRICLADQRKADVIWRAGSAGSTRGGICLQDAGMGANLCVCERDGREWE